MKNSSAKVPHPENEPIFTYKRGSAERTALKKAIADLASDTIEIPLIISGKEVTTGGTVDVVMPHQHSHFLVHCHLAGEAEVKAAIDAAMDAKSA